MHNEREQTLPRQLIRYGVVAFAGYAADYGLFTLLRLVGMHYLWAGVIAFVLGLAVNYLLGHYWAYRGRGASMAMEIGAFVLISAVSMGLNELFLWLLTDCCGIHAQISRLLTGVITFLWNFAARRWILYRKQRSEQTEEGKR